MARYLLDTHVFIWFVTRNIHLSREVDAIITDPSNEAFVSLASLWEISIKQSVGKLPPLPVDPADLISRSELTALNIGFAHIRQVAISPSTTATLSTGCSLPKPKLTA